MTSPVFDLPPGTYINDRYKILKALGRGGFGITYIAWDESTKERVAVKECFPEGLCIRETQTGSIKPARPEWEQQYLNALNDMRKEMRTLTGLNHEGIVRINDVIWGNGGVFCVMPWLQGGTLRDITSSAAGRNLTADRSISWLRMLLDALRYLHNRGIVHRDIKPTNIMFDSTGKPVIIDFGAALNRPERTTSTTTQGAFSRSYAAPEQITGKGHIGPWTDLYSLSATWYELLTGKLPEGADARLMQDDLVPLSRESSRLAYPDALLSLLNCNMSLRPTERCQNVDQWLQCWADGVLPRGVFRRTRRARLVLEGAALGCLVLGVAFGLWKSFFHEDKGDAPNTLSGEQSALPPGELTRILTDRVGEAARVKDYHAMCDRYTHRFEQCYADQISRQVSLLRQYETEINALKSREEAESYIEKVRRIHGDVLREQDSERKRIANDFDTERRSYITGTDKLAKLVPPRTQQEEMLLPHVCSDVSYKMMQRFTMIMLMAEGEEIEQRTSFTRRMLRLIDRAASLF